MTWTIMALHESHSFLGESLGKNSGIISCCYLDVFFLIQSRPSKLIAIQG